MNCFNLTDNVITILVQEKCIMRSGSATMKRHIANQNELASY